LEEAKVRSVITPDTWLSLPEIKKEKKLPVVLSKQEVWQMLSCCKLLKHKILIGLLYGCGLRCLEVRNLRLCDLFSYKDYRHDKTNISHKKRDLSESLL